MMRFSVFSEQTTRSGQRAARVVSVIREQPSWITRVAFTVAFLTLTAILLVVVLPMVILAGLVFVVLVLVRRGWMALRRGLGFDRAGRHNVRVISR
ncbi:MAG: hypothetical protein Q9O74_10430 [Planctomycetota bacterium]|nr:hypothetical protein [Planctomycetota bacterium]